MADSTVKATRDQVGVTSVEFFGWLADHGLDYQDVASVQILPEGVRNQDRVTMFVRTYARNSEGKRFLDPITKDRRAMEESWVPLRRTLGDKP